MANPIKVLIVDDHQALTEGLGSLFETNEHVRMVAAATCAADAMKALETTAVDVLVLDLCLPDMSGFDVLSAVRVNSPSVNVLILTSHDGDEAIRRALERGALGYVPKHAGGQIIIAAIRAVAARQTFLAPEVEAKLAATRTTERLTARERQVLDLAARGHTSRDIATALRSTERTVKYYLKCIFQKLDVNDRAQAVREGLRRGFIDA
jgi:DNA-binding NarL/FixJ family response regulator